MKRKLFNVLIASAFVLFPGCRDSNKPGETPREQPNVILIITDDQGHGDLGYHGNHHIHTPVLDSLAARSIRLTNFYVSPVCAPTRSSLMTGRYSLRTGVRDTYNGGAVMSADEVTLAEMLREAGYRTGLFGKWHLGDSYPSRPIDQGFDESVMHLSGGMGQVGDFTTYFRGDSSYFDPVLWHNGEMKSYQGYCTDIFTTEAIRFIEAQQEDQPFFCYLSYNAPHTPLQVPDHYYQLYKDIDPSEGFGDIPMPVMSEKDKEDARKVYAMVTNIDDNIGRLQARLEELGLVENTIMIFLTDNGPQQRRYVSGMRGRKSDVYRGGVRVPFFFSYPARYAGNRDIPANAAHIDLLPTLAELCGAEVPADRIIDGRSLEPVLQGASWPEDRSLFFYWTRKYPELYRNISLQKGHMKIVGNADHDADTAGFELFDLEADPYEEVNLVSAQPEVFRELKTELDALVTELTSSEHLVNQPLTIIGSTHENPVWLNRNDAAGERGVWSQEDIYAYWNVKILEGTYDIRFRFIKPVPAGGLLRVEANGYTLMKRITRETDIIELKDVVFREMQCQFRPFYQAGSKEILPFWVEMERTGDIGADVQ
jgi:arylsulfatase